LGLYHIVSLELILGHVKDACGSFVVSHQAVLVASKFEAALSGHEETRKQT
jgi:hypothetical protein